MQLKTFIFIVLIFSNSQEKSMDCSSMDEDVLSNISNFLNYHMLHFNYQYGKPDEMYYCTVKEPIGKIATYSIDIETKKKSLYSLYKYKKGLGLIEHKNTCRYGETGIVTIQYDKNGNRVIEDTPYALTYYTYDTNNYIIKKSNELKSNPGNINGKSNYKRKGLSETIDIFNHKGEKIHNELRKYNDQGILIYSKIEVPESSIYQLYFNDFGLLIRIEEELYLPNDSIISIHYFNYNDCGLIISESKIRKNKKVVFENDYYYNFSKTRKDEIVIEQQITSKSNNIVKEKKKVYTIDKKGNWRNYKLYIDKKLHEELVRKIKY